MFWFVVTLEVVTLLVLGELVKLGLTSIVILMSVACMELSFVLLYWMK